MTKLEIMFTIVIAIVVLLLIGYYFIKAIKQNYISKIYDGIVQAMKEAEEKFNNGEEKKQYVLLKVKELCKEVNIPYDFIATLIGKVIENIIKGYNGMTK